MVHRKPVIETGVDLRDKFALGDSPVSIEFREELRPQPFIKTWAEWAALNREQINRQTSFNSSTDRVLFTVPKGNKLMIVSVYMDIWSATPALTTGPILLHLTGLEGTLPRARVILSLATDTPAINTSNSISVTFPMPFVVDEGVTITLHNPADRTAGTAGFLGWLEPTKI